MARRRWPARRFETDLPLESAKREDTGMDGACLTLTEEIYGYEAPGALSGATGGRPRGHGGDRRAGAFVLRAFERRAYSTIGMPRWS